MSRSFRAPSGSFVRREWRAAREPFRLVLAQAELRSAPTGSGGVMVLPGFSTSDRIMVPLRSYLSSRGYDVWGWGLGTNKGNVDANTPAVADQVQQRVDQNHGEPLALIGWSLGGAFARSVARLHPSLVSTVITLATPIHGVPNYSSTADSPATKLIEQPITAFYTKQDGVLDWRSCLDHANPRALNIQVDSSHVGITLDPVVWIEIAERLAHRPAALPSQPPGPLR